MRRLSQLVAIVAAGLVISALALKFLPLPWFWVGLTVAIVSYASAALAPDAMKLAIVTCGALPIALSLAELAVVPPPDVTKTILPRLDERDELLGWRPIRSRVSQATAAINDEVVYDVTYSIDAAGRRVAPPDRGAEAEGCVFFFADSFVFGEGVEDEDTFPYQFGLKTQGRFRVINYSFSGYGAEHMLAMIERGELAADAPCEPVHIVYLALPHHVIRAAGKIYFAARGPRYRLRADGTPEYVRTNPDRPPSRSWQERLTEQLLKSRVYRALTAKGPATTNDEIDLYFALVRRAFVLFKRRWPSARIHAIAWDLRPHYVGDQARFHARLGAMGAELYFVDQILPGYVTDPGRYSVHPSELHPSPRAHEMIASFLAARIVGTQRLTDASHRARRGARTIVTGGVR